jgi:hypothetical protein
VQVSTVDAAAQTAETGPGVTALQRERREPSAESLAATRELEAQQARLQAAEGAAAAGARAEAAAAARVQALGEAAEAAICTAKCASPVGTLTCTA